MATSRKNTNNNTLKHVVCTEQKRPTSVWEGLPELVDNYPLSTLEVLPYRVVPVGYVATAFLFRVFPLPAVRPVHVQQYVVYSYFTEDVFSMGGYGMYA